jgi:mannose-6-phosphate isomerase
VAEPRLIPLRGAVQHYEWGGYDFIPRLLGMENPRREPFAELWIGVHPKAPSLALLPGGEQPLNEFLAARSGSLPFLLKVQDARRMLSIQAHPNKAQAEEGFARENAAGIPLQAGERNYKDDNHKPEVNVALSEFWMLHGFRPLDQIAAEMRRQPELAALMPEFDQRLAQAPDELLPGLYEAAMTLPQPRVDAILNPLLARLERESPAKDTPGYWALRAARDFPRADGGRDRGIFSIYLLNLVRLQPGQGTYQPVGILHAYLEGVNMELMANSDNVLRGGLTPKHVNVPELLRTVRFEAGEPAVLDGEAVSETERVYRTGAAEFELSRIAVEPGQDHRGQAATGAEALIVIEGESRILASEETLALPRGGIVFVPAGESYRIESAGSPAVLFKAAIPA